MTAEFSKSKILSHPVIKCNFYSDMVETTNGSMHAARLV